MEFVFDSDEKDDLSSEIEMLMDIVNLESSGRYLNEWRYGFNPKDPSITNASPAQRTKMLNDFHQNINEKANKLESDGQIEQARALRGISKNN